MLKIEIDEQELRCRRRSSYSDPVVAAQVRRALDSAADHAKAGQDATARQWLNAAERASLRVC